jgi:hypothetical protein
LALGEEVKFTPLGIFSGMLWVTASTCSIYAIRNAGLAVAVGTWASVIVLVNFVWGICIFREPVRSLWGATVAFFFLVIGLVGMSRYSSPLQKQEGDQVRAIEIIKTVENDEDGLKFTRRRNPEEPDDDHGPLIALIEDSKFTRRRNPEDPDDDHGPLIEDPEVETDDKKDKGNIFFFAGRRSLTKKQLGIAFSLLTGLLSGSSMVPIHFAKAQGFGGLSYMISFGCGSMISNIIIWVVYFLFNYCQQTPGGSFENVYKNMPPVKFLQMWRLGLAAGSLLSAGMFAAIMANTYLGQGVGNSLVQLKIFISGMWGIFFFKEIQEKSQIVKWFLSALLCVASILCLSYQRFAATKPSNA